MGNVGQLFGYANTKNKKNTLFHVFFCDELITGRVTPRISCERWQVCGCSIVVATMEVEPFESTPRTFGSALGTVRQVAAEVRIA
jgi:hypothetical protein